MSYKPNPGAGQAVINVNSPSGGLPVTPFRPLFNDFGPPSMGYMQTFPNLCSNKWLGLRVAF